MKRKDILSDFGLENLSGLFLTELAELPMHVLVGDSHYLDCEESGVFFAPSIATVATGIPEGICAVDRIESRPRRAFDMIGTPDHG